jgi:hypothetical protein
MLFDALAEEAKEAVLAWWVVRAGTEQNIDLDLLERDVMLSRTYLRLDPNVIFFEGGLGAGEDNWRVPRLLLEQSVRAGGIAVIADVEINELIRSGPTIWRRQTSSAPGPISDAITETRSMASTQDTRARL